MKPATHIDKLEVLIGESNVGTLLSSRGEIYFEYAPGWIASGFPLSPMQPYRLKSGAFKASTDVFGGLHGVFNDSLPDGWGLLLMDRALKKKYGWNPHQITVLDRLAYIGNRAMGAMRFKPVFAGFEQAEMLSVSEFAAASLLVQQGRVDDVLNALYIHGGSPGGARPKITVALERDGDLCISGFESVPENFDHWIIKFRAKDDPQSMGRIELAYAKMAQAAKISMPNTKLVNAVVLANNEDYFATQRFDRVGNEKRHVISLGGMLEVSHRVPSMDYEHLLKAVGFATQDYREVEKAFRLMVFNILAHNKDDHVKNFSFIYSEDGWKLTPGYDLTFSSGMNNEHATSVAGDGRPTLASIIKVAGNVRIKSWAEIFGEVFDAVSMWPAFAADCNVPQEIIGQYAEAMETEPAYVDFLKQRATTKRIVRKTTIKKSS